MIAMLSGMVIEKLPGMVVVEAGGVGYGVYMSIEDLARLRPMEEVKLYIHEHLREQAHDLFGFLSRDTQSLFEQLLEVNGVGPKMALNMLSIAPVSEVRLAIASGNVKFLQTASGVGKRVAERVIVELKDKVGLIGVDLETTGLLQSEDSLIRDEAVEALVALGYTANDASRALQNIDADLPTPERIKLALKETK
ncbi:MAG TPA: Holliday junction branch migration protein RuvA [Candidatus Saccharimonadales bacterium]|jgi:Holliday junction DNA helicase RuvA|nr:Holliday junction branch migration protein RuvA [Candidatus Saccharimonadales bacterium]